MPLGRSDMPREGNMQKHYVELISPRGKATDNDDVICVVIKSE